MSEDTMNEQALTIEDIEAALAATMQPVESWQPFEGDPDATWEYWNPEFDRAGEPVREDWIWERLRHRRDQLLAACDWRVVPDAPWDTAPWIEYRQALRDLPKAKNPRKVKWPEPPA